MVPVQLTFLSAEPPARDSASPAPETGYTTSEALSLGIMCGWLERLSRGGSCGKTSRACCLPIKELTSETSCKPLSNAGIACAGGFSTLSILESPSDAEECSLSDILEGTGDNLRRYFLSPKACAGILRRSKKRGLKIPDLLEHCLQTVAEQVDLRETVMS